MPEALKPYVKPEVKPNSKTGGKEAPENPDEILIPSSAKTEKFLSPENKGFFSKMSKDGKDIANGVFAKLYEFSAVKWLDRGVKHIEVAYNQSRMSGKEEKAVQFKTQMDGLEFQTKALADSKKDVTDTYNELIRLKVPGAAESLQLELKKIEKQEREMKKEHDKMQSKFEASENIMKLYANKRDRVADKLISDYTEKLRPMEKELENLQMAGNKMNLMLAVTEAKHQKEAARLDNLEGRKQHLEDALVRAGTAAGKSMKTIQKEIRSNVVIQNLDNQITQGRKDMMVEKEKLAKQMAKIDEKKAKVDAKANPYRDKREEFVRVKEGRPIKIDVATRVRGAEFKGKEEIGSHTRAETVGSAREEKPIEEKPAEENKSEESEAEAETEQEVQSLILAWNAQLVEKYKTGIAKNELINIADFLKETSLSGTYKLDAHNFKNILGTYYDLKKMSKDKFWGIGTDFEKKVNPAK